MSRKQWWSAYWQQLRNSSIMVVNAIAAILFIAHEHLPLLLPAVGPKIYGYVGFALAVTNMAIKAYRARKAVGPKS